MTETTITQPTSEPLVDTYFAMWRATDSATRADLIAASFAVEGRHVDPAADVTGHDQLAAMLDSVHTTYPGFTIERTSAIDQHGNQVRYGWSLAAADGTPLLAGLDVGELAQDGRFARIASFWGELPER